MKSCSKCYEIKEEKLFYKDKRATDGLYSHCKECHKKFMNKWMGNNKDVFKKYQKKWNANNKDKTRARTKKWQSKNRDVGCYHSNLRRSRQQVFFKKLNEFQKQEVLDIYKMREDLSLASLSAGSNVVYHVDHIMPLKGGGFCGLHAPWNLQILTAEDNQKKYNKI